jgi:nitric oxide reductase large subunit
MNWLRVGDGDIVLAIAIIVIAWAFVYFFNKSMKGE